MNIPREVIERALDAFSKFMFSDSLGKCAESITELRAALEVPEVEPVLDYCTDPDNCRRCKTHPNHRGDMEHNGIGKRP